MYKPQTVEQFRVKQFLDTQFDMDAFILSPVSRYGLMLEDAAGSTIAFAYENGNIRQIPVPVPISKVQVKDFLSYAKQEHLLPSLHNYREVTHWWLHNTNPLTYQQALGLSDEMYRHFLTRPILEEEELLALAKGPCVTELQLKDMELWFLLNRGSPYSLIPSAVRGVICYYRLIADFLSPDEQEYEFALKDKDYCEHYGLPYTPA